MSNFNSIVQKLQESKGAEILFQLLESVGNMTVELNALKRKLEALIEDDMMPTAINELDLPAEFIEEIGNYQKTVEELQSEMLGV